MKSHLAWVLVLVACGGRAFAGAEQFQSGGRSTVDGGDDGGEQLAPGDDGGELLPDGGAAPQGGAPSGGSASGTSGRTGQSGNATGGNVAAAGADSGNDGGDGGIMAAACESLPDRATWIATAFPAPAGWPAAAVADGDPETRWTSERPTQGDEWVTLEFPQPVTLSAIVVRSVFEPGEGWAVRLGNDLDQTANPIVAQGDGDNADEILGDVLMQFAAPASGAFLTLQQTGAKADSAWSVYEITPVCEAP